MSVKLGRRDALKIMAAVGAAIAVTPYIASVSSLTQKFEVAAGNVQNKPLRLGEEDIMVIVVKGDQAMGYTGNQEIRIDDGTLMYNIRNTFRSGKAE